MDNVVGGKKNHHLSYPNCNVSVLLAYHSLCLGRLSNDFLQDMKASGLASELTDIPSTRPKPNLASRRDGMEERGGEKKKNKLLSNPIDNKGDITRLQHPPLNLNLGIQLACSLRGASAGTGNRRRLVCVYIYMCVSE